MLCHLALRILKKVEKGIKVPHELYFWAIDHIWVWCHRKNCAACMQFNQKGVGE